MKVIVKRPGEEPEVVEMLTALGTLESLQAIVGGYIEMPVTGFAGVRDADLFCNEEGKLLGLDANIRMPELRDVIMGPVVIAKGNHKTGATLGLTDNMIEPIMSALRKRAL